MNCNICGGEEFNNMGARPNIRCVSCNSLERTRLIALQVERELPLNENSRILHIAPEHGLAMYFHKIAGDNCTFVDLEPERFTSIPNMQGIDLCKDLAQVEANSFDLIVHSHVLEHLPCNYTYVLYHMHRVLKPEGKMICSIPFMGGYFDSCTNPSLSDEERQTRFGQNDHVVRFGREDLQMTIGRVYDLPETYDISKQIDPEVLLGFNIPEYTWRDYTPSTVMVLNKNDYKLA